MPDVAVDVAVGAAATADKKSTHLVNPDRVGEELADDANVWHVYEQVAKEDDERRTKAWDSGLNNLALFAGLFSAVTTAFIIEAQQDMKPDYAQLAFLVLNATAAGEKFVQEPFIVPPSARRVNCVWIASLILSLSASMIAIMGKDWIGMYTSRPICNLRQWAEIRTYRLLCVDRWRMSGVIAAAPVLLHLSLLLFGAGLVIFISSDPFTHHLTLGLCLAAGALYLVTALSAVVFSSSPFKSPATQMLRRSLAVCVFRVRNILVYRPMRDRVYSLLDGIRMMIFPRRDGSASAPQAGLIIPDPNPTQGRLSTSSMSWTSQRTISAIAQSIPSRLRSFHEALRWSTVKRRLDEALAAFHSVSVDDWSTSSTWTDISVDRRPELVAASLSWLNSASQAPAVFRALIFALGDLEIGRQVAPLVSEDLRSRFDVEVRRTKEHADFLTLSRYVLAEHNLHGTQAGMLRMQFERFLSAHGQPPACEDGIAVAIILHVHINRILAYPAEHATQPRMMEFLLPFLLTWPPWDLATVIFLANLYWRHLHMNQSFDWKKEISQRLFRRIRTEYASAVADRYGGKDGAVELLTFLCCHDHVGGGLKAAVEFIMNLIGRESQRQHQCLSYLFGRPDLRHVAWPEEGWSISRLISIARSFMGSITFRELSHEREFNIARARTTVMLLSPRHRVFGDENLRIMFLFDHLSNTTELLDGEGKLEIIRLILEEGTLFKILVPVWHFYDRYAPSSIGILATITTRICGLLRRPATRHDAMQLFTRLVFAEVKGANDEPLTWDLGDWIRTRARSLTEEQSSVMAPMQEFHNSMTLIQSLCAHAGELRASWDRLGLPERLADIFPYPFPDIGEFFAHAEAPREPPVDIFSGTGMAEGTAPPDPPFHGMVFGRAAMMSLDW